ncbi:Uncharacterised protein [uncultured archaeon]|nr:Uncharacterised protein [uncultured archaeon]
MNNSNLLSFNRNSQISYSKSLADWAKTEVLKDLVKQKVKEKYGLKLEKVADDLVELMFENDSISKDIELEQFY